jgi:maltose alpha-D-glucosyltransferase/alpha-amylase
VVPGQPRSDPHGPYGDFYVWSDTDETYDGVRIIFVDTEESNWTFDPVRRQFFWHRFFSHQPDLNYENPAVIEAMKDVVRFWMDMGIDGFRLDAIPYLIEEEGHNGENHPAHPRDRPRDPRHGGRRVSRSDPARRGQPAAADVVDYFGTEEAPECQMCFHFPVMPMLYYSPARGAGGTDHRRPRRHPAIPAGGQWGTFLRNHDELTLEMVTPEQRAAMYGWYAPDPRMRANVGIRRRLWPAARQQPDPRSSSSTPCALAARAHPACTTATRSAWATTSGSRTATPPHPDAVDPDRNAGFSTADPGKLYLPVIDSLGYNRQPRSTSKRAGQPSSFLHWLRRMLAVRKRTPGLRGRRLHPLTSVNERVLAFLRTDRRERDKEDRSARTVLCVNNLSSRRPGRDGDRARRSMPGRGFATSSVARLPRSSATTAR